MVRRVLAAGIAIVIGTITVTACGSDSSALSADEFRTEANKICDEGAERLEELGQDLADSFEGDEAPSEEAISDAMTEILDEIEDQIADLRALEGPDDLESDVNDVLDDAISALDDLRDQLEEDPMSVLESEEDPFADVNERLTELDLEKCGES